MFSKLNSLIDGISKEKGVKKDVIVKALESAFVSVVRKKLGELGSVASLEATYSPQDDDVSIYQFKMVLSNNEEDGTARVLSEVELITSLLLKDAQALDPEVEVGDEIGLVVDSSLKELNRKNIQLFKQILLQKITDAERKTLLDTFSDKKGKIVSGIVKVIDSKGNALVDLGSAEAILYRKEMMETDNFTKNSKVSALLLDVSQSGGRTPQIILSRNSHLFLMKKLEDDCQSIEDGTIEIVKISREGGVRSKVVVKSHDSSVNALSEILGDNGYKIQSISDSLNGEKINIIIDTNNRADLLVNALKPGAMEYYTESEASINVIVEREELGKVIGKRGSNLRAVASLLGKRVNVISSDTLSSLKTLSREEFTTLSGLNALSVEKLLNKEVFSVKSLSLLSADDISAILGTTSEEASQLKADATAVIAKKDFIPVTEQISLVESYGLPKEFSIPVKSKRSVVSAERRLREELASFNLK